MQTELKIFPTKFFLFKRRFIEFTLLQLVQHNVQLGASTKFSLLSSR